MSDALKTHIYNPDGHWGTSAFRAATLTTPITSLHFCAHTNETNEGSDDQPPTNHWSLYLEIDPTSSVCVDMVPSGPHEPGMIILEPYHRGALETPIHEEVVVLPTGTTVAAILHVLVAKKRDRYIFSPVGEGCRHWLSVVVADLAEAGLVPDGFVENVRVALARYWRYPDGASELRKIAEGTFF